MALQGLEDFAALRTMPSVGEVMFMPDPLELTHPCAYSSGNMRQVSTSPQRPASVRCQLICVHLELQDTGCKTLNPTKESFALDHAGLTTRFDISDVFSSAKCLSDDKMTTCCCMRTLQNAQDRWLEQAMSTLNIGALTIRTGFCGYIILLYIRCILYIYVYIHMYPYIYI